MIAEADPPEIRGRLVSPSFALSVNSATFARKFRRFHVADAVWFASTRAVETNPLETSRLGVR